MADRPLVPSARQGPLPAPRPPVTPGPEAGPARPRDRWGWVRDLDPRGIDGPKRPLAILALVAAVTRWEQAALGVLLPDIRTEFGLNVAFLATLSSAVALITILLALPMGYLADRVKRVVMVRTSALLLSASSVLQGAAGGIPHLVLGRVLSGVGLAVTQPASLPLLTDLYPSHSRARVFASLYAAGELGAVGGPVLAGVLGEALGWRTVLVALGTLAGVVSLLTLWLREPVRGQIDRLEMGADAETATHEQPPPTWGEAYRAARSITTLRRLWYATPLAQLAGGAGILLLPLAYAELYQVDTAGLGVIVTLQGVVGLIALLVGGPFADRMLRDRPGRLMNALGLVLLLQAAGFVGFAAAPSLPVAVAGGLVISFASALCLPALFIMVSLVVPARIRGLGLQTTAPWQLIGVVLFPILIGVTASLGSRGLVLVFAPLVAVEALILGSAAAGFERDIRSARAASMADEDARRARAEGRIPLLVCRGVEAGYGPVPVLFGVDLDVEAGEVVALLGTNGAGKSTLLQALAGINEASGGAIVFDGRDITHSPPHQITAAGVVLMPGGRAVFPDLTVEDNLRIAMWVHRGGHAASAEARLAQVLDTFPVLRTRLDRRAGTLSGGEQQMVGLGQALLVEPRLLLIDELSLGLAPAVVEQLLVAVKALAETGVAVVLVEQSLNVALTAADRAVFLEKGEVRYTGPTTGLLDRPDLVRSVFLGGDITVGGRRRSGWSNAPAEPVLEVAGLAVAFGGVAALGGVDLNVRPGEVVGIIGANGAGKTTLFDAISGFAPTESGTVRLAGADITGLRPDARARRGLVRSFQSARLFSALTVREALLTSLEKRAARNPLLAALWWPSVRASEARLARRAQELIDLLGLRDYADTVVGELSTGTRRTVDVGCVLAAEPLVLLLDEPSSGLAQAEVEGLGPVLLRIVRETGCALLVIEHDIPLVSSIADRLVVLDLGATLAEGPPAEVLADPRVLGSYLAASGTTIARSGGRERPE